MPSAVGGDILVQYISRADAGESAFCVVLGVQITVGVSIEKAMSSFVATTDAPFTMQWSTPTTPTPATRTPKATTAISTTPRDESVASSVIAADALGDDEQAAYRDEEEGEDEGRSKERNWRR
jgi:hypothetical protein